MALAVIYAVMYWTVGLHCSHWCARGDRKGSSDAVDHAALSLLCATFWPLAAPILYGRMLGLRH